MNMDNLLNNRKDVEEKLIYETLSRAPIGTKLDFQLLLKREHRISVELIGIEDDKFIIIKLPSSLASNDFPCFKAGSPGVIRMLLEGTNGICIAFRTEVVSTINYPSKLVFFQFPSQLQTLVLRKENRVDVFFKSSMRIVNDKSRNDSNELSGHIIDISPNGCRFKTKMPVKSTLKRTVKLTMKMNNGERLETIGMIKNVKLLDGDYFIGIQFANSGDGVSFMFDESELAS